MVHYSRKEQWPRQRRWSVRTNRNEPTAQQTCRGYELTAHSIEKSTTPSGSVSMVGVQNRGRCPRLFMLIPFGDRVGHFVCAGRHCERWFRHGLLGGSRRKIKASKALGGGNGFCQIAAQTHGEKKRPPWSPADEDEVATRVMFNIMNIVHNAEHCVPGIMRGRGMVGRTLRRGASCRAVMRQMGIVS